MGWKTLKRKISMRSVKRGLKKIVKVAQYAAWILPFIGIPVPLLLTQIASFGWTATAAKKLGITQAQLEEIQGAVEGAGKDRDLKSLIGLRNTIRGVKSQRRYARRQYSFARSRLHM